MNVYYKHIHYTKYGQRTPGVTFCIDHDKSSNDLTISWAVCSDEDNFSREIGRHISYANMNRGDVVFGVRDYDMPLEANILRILEDTEFFDPRLNHYKNQAIDAVYETYLLEAIDILRSSSRDIDRMDWWSGTDYHPFLTPIVAAMPFFRF